MCGKIHIQFTIVALLSTQLSGIGHIHTGAAIPISTLPSPQTEALSLLNTDPAPPQPGTPTRRAQDLSAPAFGSGTTQNLPPCVWLVSRSTGSSRGPSFLRLNPPQHGGVHPFIQPRPLRLSHISSRACPIHLPPAPLPHVVREELCGLQPRADQSSSHPAPATPASWERP